MAEKDSLRMKFDDCRLAEEVTWQMRLADLTRAENRDILNRTFNGDPPFDKSTAEENNIEVNRNFLEGTGNLTDARTQWNLNFLKPGDLFTVRVDCKQPNHKQHYSNAITKSLNRVLKSSLGMVSQARETGAGVLLHGVGPTNWMDRRGLVPKVLPISSLMIPGETDIDFENLEHFAIYREMTPAQLYNKTHGPQVDPGWNMDVVKSELKYVGEQTQKEINAGNYQYMPERITEAIKQDGGFWGSDAVPTIDYWDFFFREQENGEGWYRRAFLDWGSSGREIQRNSKYSPVDSPNNGEWLYTSKDKVYANNWQEIIHCNYGDCSCVAPFKYRSVRSLAWMIWGICDIQNRMYCKTAEQAFSDLMWFFRTASNNDFTRLKKANFLQMGVIPQGIDWIKGNERFTPNPTFIEMVINQNRSLMAQHSASFTRSTERTQQDKEKTATQVLAEVNSINTLVSGVMNMAYTYEAFKYREIARRACIPNNPDPLARKFRKLCLDDGVPAEYLNVDRWEIEPERAMGAGNKTVQMAIVQYLQSIRQNLGPEAQRKVDHMGIQIMTDDETVAEDLAPIRGMESVSNSAHDASLVTERLMRGLPFRPKANAVIEDYVTTWLQDLAVMVQQVQAQDNMGTPEKLMGFQNMMQHIGMFLQQMATDPEARQKVRQYGDILGQLSNVIKGFAQRLQEQMQASNGGQPGVDPETIGKIQSMQILAQAKAKNTQEQAALRASQGQARFELEEARKDRQHAADLRREQELQAVETIGDLRKQAMEQQQPETPTE